MGALVAGSLFATACTANSPESVNAKPAATIEAALPQETSTVPQVLGGLVSYLYSPGYLEWAENICAPISPDLARAETDLTAENASPYLLDSEVVNYGDVVFLGTPEGMATLTEIANEVFTKANTFMTEEHRFKGDGRDLSIKFYEGSCKDNEATGSPLFNAYASPPFNQTKDSDSRVTIVTHKDTPLPKDLLRLILTHEAGHHIYFDSTNTTLNNPDRVASISAGSINAFFENYFQKAVSQRYPGLGDKVDAMIKDPNIDPVSRYWGIYKTIEATVTQHINEGQHFNDNLSHFDESSYVAFAGGHPYDNYDEMFASMYSIFTLFPDTYIHNINATLGKLNDPEAQAKLNDAIENQNLTRAFYSILASLTRESSGMSQVQANAAVGNSIGSKQVNDFINVIDLKTFFGK